MVWIGVDEMFKVFKLPSAIVLTARGNVRWDWGQSRAQCGPIGDTASREIEHLEVLEWVVEVLQRWYVFEGVTIIQIEILNVWKDANES